MKIIPALLSLGLVSTAYSAPAAFAQEEAFQMPEQCSSASATAEMDHSSMGHHSSDAGTASHTMGSEKSPLSEMPDHVQENMRRMMVTMPAMEKGMKQEDADVAFACAMIAHHQGAIDMAQVLIEYGDDPEMIELAGEIIAAQVGEIDQMKAWLAKNAN